MKKKKRICLAASSGGHFEQILMLIPLLEQYDGFVLTEKTDYSESINNIKIRHVKQVNRKESFYRFKLFYNTIISFFIFIRERPKVIICTGALAMIPMCLIVKIFGGKLIYIESFAKISSPTKTGKLLYKYADKFYIQWESMKEFYPDAEFLGGIY